MAKKEASLLVRIKTAGEETLDSVKSKFAGIATAATAAFAVIAGVVTKALYDYREQEKAVNSLSQAMANNGIFSSELRDEYVALADALSKTTAFGDEQIIAAQAAAQQQLGQTKITKELTVAILDFAQAQGIDAAQAAEVVGKSISTSTNALARYGIQVNSAASESEKMAQVIDGLSGKFGGQAAAATQGLGSYSQMTKAFGELSEQLGQRLAPAFTLAFTYFTKLAQDTSTVTPIINTFVESLRLIAVVGVHAWNLIRGLGEEIGINLAVATQLAADATSLNMKKIANTWKMGKEELANAEIKREQDKNAALNSINDAFRQERATKDQEDLALLQQNLEQKKAITEGKALEAREAELQRRVTEQEEDLAFEMATEEQQNQMQIEKLNKQLTNETDHRTRLDLLKQKSLLLEQQSQLKHNKTMEEFDKQAAKTREDNLRGTLGTISTLQNSNNKALAAAGKAAAITQIAIDTPVAISKALASAPPPFNFGLAGLVGAAMAGQAARIAGVQLAEGGIVMPRAGGTQATIGEGGQAEAVIPLDRAGEFGLGGGGVTINVYGGLLGDRASAYEFAKAVDSELLNLRRNNESRAFDSGVT